MNRTLYFGEGLFETIRWKGVNRKLKLHYERLRGSAEFFGIPCPTFEEFIREISQKAKGECYVKFCLFSKGGNYYADRSEGYEIKVIVRELPEPPSEVKLTLSPFQRHSSNPLWRHKTMNYLFNVLVKREAKEKGFFDAVILNERDEITECSASNLLLLKGEKLYTPSSESGLLWGTTLEVISREIGVKEERLKLRDLEEANGVFITNSLMGAVPVVEVEGSRKEIDREVFREMNDAINSYLKPEKSFNKGSK